MTDYAEKDTMGNSPFSLSEMNACTARQKADDSLEAAQAALQATELAQRTALEAAKSTTINSAIQNVASAAESTQAANQAAMEALQAAHKAEQAAAQALRSKNLFLASISHDLRTPVHIALGMLEMLSGTELSPEQTGYVSTTTRACRHLFTLLNELLDLTKMEAGQFSLEHRTFSLHTLLQESRDAFEFQARDKHITLKISHAESVPDMVHGDPDRLRQVLWNLIGNALKFTVQGGIKVDVEKASGKGMIRFRVRDTGIGIPSDRHDLIFQPFTQADSLTYRKYGGTGLGLSICRHLVGMMGGGIEVRSVPGAGSTFQFTANLPAAVMKGCIQKPSDSMDKTPDGIGDRMCERDILIVDDSDDVILLYRAFLRNTPYRIETASNGKQALEMAATKGYDLILMDIQMPIMDGNESMAAIRRQEEIDGTSPVPIIALTAHAFAEAHMQAMASGATHSLTKPIGKDQLISSIEELTQADSQSVAA
ncbi:MAG: response regulator [Magnetococcales bacterium]|nr:response regulator [Magnetococcales bacterium]